MLVVRPVVKSDLDQLFELSSKVTVGLTTFPHDRKFLDKRIKKSVQSFSEVAEKPGGENYMFVMEDLETLKLVGTSAIFSKVGGYEPSYSYKIETTTKQSKTLKVKKTISYLKLKRDYDGPTEIGTLFLHPEYRKQGNGRLLSLSRFLFMAQHPKCFESTVMVEIRGVIDNRDHSPFWEALGHHFFDIEFKKADLMVMKDKSFIADLMPEHPIYIPLLPKAAQAVIGQVHRDTQPALHLLESEGFVFNNEIDIFEAGPTLAAKLNKIRTVKESKVGQIARISDAADDSIDFLIANIGDFNNFRVTLGCVKILGKGEIEVARNVASALQVKEGNWLRFSPLRGKDRLGDRP